MGFITNIVGKVSSVFRHTNIVDQINKGHYKVMMPQIYTPIPDYYMEYGFQPIYEYDNDSQYELARGTCTIAEMIDMYSNGYNFIILNDKDTIDVYNLVSRYLDLLNTIDHLEYDAVVIKEKIIRFKTGITSEYNCACRRLNVVSKDENSLDSLLSDMVK